MPSSRNSIKDEVRTKIIRTNWFHMKTRAVILLDISDSDISNWLLEAWSVLDISFVISTGLPEEKQSYPWFDACISNLKSNYVDIVALVKSWVVPILPQENLFASNFTEFDPMKFMGNAFLYEKETSYHIFEKLIRYLENVRYSWDKRTLLSNIEKTF